MQAPVSEGAPDQRLQLREVREELGLETEAICGIQRGKVPCSDPTDAFREPVHGTRKKTPQNPGDGRDRSDALHDPGIHMHPVASHPRNLPEVHVPESKPAQDPCVGSPGIRDELVEEDHPDLRRREMGLESPDLGHVVGHLEQPRHPEEPGDRLGPADPANRLLRAELRLEIPVARHAIREMLTMEGMHHLDGFPEQDEDPRIGIEACQPLRSHLGDHVQWGALPKPTASCTRAELLEIALLGQRWNPNVG